MVNLFFSRSIEEFLDNSPRNKKLFLVGSKGQGKTLILKAKSQIFRDNNKSYKYIPEDRLTEKFSQIGYSISKKDFNKFKGRNLWDKTWEFCLLCLILRRFNISLPQEINKHIGYASDLAEILISVLQSRGKIDRLYMYVNTHLKPFVRELPKQGINQIAIFIDNIDEGFDEHVGYSLNYPESRSSNLSEEV